MLRRWLLCLPLLLFASAAGAQVCPGLGGATKAYAKETLTISSTALPFTSSVYADGIHTPLFAEVRLETNNIRYWSTGNVPTASVGVLVEAVTGGNVKFTVCGQATIQAFQMIRTSADATVTVQYYGAP